MKELDLKAIAELMNRDCDAGIGVSKFEGKFLTSDHEGGLRIIDKNLIKKEETNNEKI